jgi:DNA polymerase III subunit delta'
LPTIVSRCEVIRLRPVLTETIVQGLTNHTSLSPEQALHLAHISDGMPGYAIYLSQQPKILEQRNTWLEDLHKLLHAHRLERFDYVKPFLKKRNMLDRQKFRDLLLVWLSYWRDIMLRSSGTDTSPANIDRLEEIDEIANHLGLYRSFQVVKSLERALALLSINVNGRLLAEVTMLDLPNIRD